ncbi:enoyl-CoA hydratase/isomerase family protein [Dactylosporangium vinaceum]|nr:enoyl-CoA hydratase/isomerase family protein [Dactylosporangium vinaceum]
MGPIEQVEQALQGEGEDAADDDHGEDAARDVHGAFLAAEVQPAGEDPGRDQQAEHQQDGASARAEHVEPVAEPSRALVPDVGEAVEGIPGFSDAHTAGADVHHVVAVVRGGHGTSEGTAEYAPGNDNDVEETLVDSKTPLVRLEVADGIGTIRLDRPPMNALNIQLQEELRAAAEDASARDDVRAVVVYGGEKVFAAGADIKEMAGMGYAEMSARAGRLTSAFDAVARIPKPVVAAITGFALGGGCELALTADWRVAAEDAKLGQPEITLGIIPGAGGTQRLSRLIGPARAKDLIMSGRFVAAPEALAIGLVDRVVPKDDVYAAAVDLVRPYVNGPALALRAAKLAVDGGLEMDLASALTWESQLFAGLFATEDKAEGMSAFVEKRKPTFKGR